MKKWMWLTVPVVVIGLAVVLWGGSVFAQEPAKAPGTCGGNWTETAGYCQNATGIMGAGGMMGTRGMAGMMGRGGMMGGFPTTGVNGTDMYQYCQNATGTAGYGGMMGTGSFGRGMMGR